MRVLVALYHGPEKIPILYNNGDSTWCSIYFGPVRNGIFLSVCTQWPNISANDPDPAIPVQAQRVLILYFCFFFKDDKAHIIHDKDLNYQNSIMKPHTR